MSSEFLSILQTLPGTKELLKDVEVDDYLPTTLPMPLVQQLLTSFMKITPEILNPHPNFCINEETPEVTQLIEKFYEPKYFNHYDQYQLKKQIVAQKLPTVLVGLVLGYMDLVVV